MTAPTSITVLGQSLALAYPNPRDTRVCDVCGGSGERRFRGECDTCPRCKGCGHIQAVAAGGVQIAFVRACGCERVLELPAKRIRIGALTLPGYLDLVTSFPDHNREAAAVSWLEAEQRSIGREVCAACAVAGEMRRAAA